MGPIFPLDPFGGIASPLGLGTSALLANPTPPIGPAGARSGSIGVLGQGGKPPRPAVPSVLLFLVFRLSLLWLLDDGGDGRSSASEKSSGRGSRTWIGRLRTRISFRIRILIPWSAREHDSGVDSDNPAMYTADS